MNRRTPRYIKEIVFYAMARNHAINHFLNLSEPLPRALYFNIPMNEDYWNLMQKVGATRYPLGIKQKAERHLFNDYTHIDYKRRHHFLDVPLPEKPPIYRLFESAIKITSGGIQFWWIFVIVFIAWKYIEDDSSPAFYPNSSSGYSNTFNSEGIPSGNTAFTSTSDSFQVQDSSEQAGFGNEGLSGHDASSSQALHDVESIPAPYSSIPGSDSEGEEEAMGTPDSVNNQSFRYRFSNIYFDMDGRVNGWSRIKEPLNVILYTTIKEAHPFTIGSTVEEVIAIMGTPDSYSNSSLSYEYSRVHIRDGKVISYSDISHNLVIAK
ncbi:hypothetical protein [Paenibacillus sp. Z6-24]